tara:strand:- start:16821 stop:17726 length:906 start_codon:yes stop_codon:yes gene_type:complete
MQTNHLSGTHTALVTPMDNAGRIAFDDLEKLIDNQIESGVQGLVVLGTTGEAPTLSAQERAELIRFAKRTSQGRVPITVGTGSYNTQAMIELSQEAEDLGADALLCIAPYYNKPTQEGLFQHFSALAQKTELPIILYSHPGRCGVEIGLDTVARLHEAYPHICGIKEASGSCDRVSALRQKLDKHFIVTSGDDTVTLPFIAVGGQGVISVAANAFPELVVSLVQMATSNDFSSAQGIHQQYYSLFKTVLGLETNPVPIKHALHILGKISSSTVRLPLCPLSEANQSFLEKILEPFNTTVYA